MRTLDESDAAAIQTLERRLLEFYRTCTTYPAFVHTSDHPVVWGEVVRLAKALREERGRCRILEVGAGRSGFGRFLRQRVPETEIHLSSQDITATNLQHLRKTSEEVITSNLDELTGEWDVIFHTYAYEHLCRPRQFNEQLWAHLTPGGYLVVQSPRYDFPLYPPPAFDHLPLLVRLGHMVRLAAGDVAATLMGRARFSVWSDPAVFHLPFERDRDAVHRVRAADLRRQFEGRAEFRQFALPAGSWKDWLVKRFFTLRVVLRKLPARGEACQ